MYPRLPQTSWATQDKSWPLFAFILSDKQSLNKIYRYIFKYKRKKNSSSKEYILGQIGFVFGGGRIYYFCFITNTLSNLKTSLADRLVYSSPLWTISYLLMKFVLMVTVEEELLKVALKFPHPSRKPFPDFASTLFFHCRLFTKSAETRKSLSET